MDAHQEAISQISFQIFTFNQDKVLFRLYHGSTNSTQSRKVDPSRMVYTSSLNHVLSVNKESKNCLVKPNVPMDQLVDATLPHGLVPPVVMEFHGITVGGGFAGTAGESKGFRYGFYEDTVNWIEIVLANGETVTASPHERSDLFYRAAGTFGTLGMTTMLELRLIDAKRYVELTYHPTTSIPNATKVQQFSRAQDPWFYVHADRTTRRSLAPVKEATALRDYLFRYDRGAFWRGKYAFDYFMVGFNRVTRYLLDHFLHTRVMYHALHESGHVKKYMIQDLLLPEDMAGQFIEYVSKEFGFWPLWLCPFTIERGLSLQPRLPNTEKEAQRKTFINVGVWGPGSTTYTRFVEQNRQLEHKVCELGGIKWLYAQAYDTEDELNAIHDRQWYDELREVPCNIPAHSVREG